MHKLLLSFFLVIFSLISGFSQFFAFDPTANYEATVSANEYSSHIVFMENLTGGELTLGWERISMDFHEEWEADLCDYVGCYLGIPESGVMLPVEDTIRGYLKVTLNPNNRVYSGSVSFKVFDTKFPDQADTLTFVIHTVAITNIASNDLNSGFSVYPNPASDLITVDMQNLESASEIIVQNMRGQIVSQEIVSSQKKLRFNVSGWPKGVYLLGIHNENGWIARQKFVVD